MKTLHFLQPQIKVQEIHYGNSTPKTISLPSSGNQISVLIVKSSLIVTVKMGNYNKMQHISQWWEDQRALKTKRWQSNFSAQGLASQGRDLIWDLFKLCLWGLDSGCACNIVLGQKMEEEYFNSNRGYKEKGKKGCLYSEMVKHQRLEFQSVAK